MADRFKTVRHATMVLSQPLSAEDQTVQSMPDASPTKWHLAHTTWFFETFVLRDFAPDYRPFDPDYHYLFNSYYEAEGARHPRPERGMLTRPALAEIREYRSYVDRAILALLDRNPPEPAQQRMELGLHHEQQHQELILMDIKHVLAQNPLRPAYDRRAALTPSDPPPDLDWISCQGGLVEIGDAGNGFAFDNERPRHKVYVNPFALANRPVTNGDFLSFMRDRGYQRPELWLSDGWLHIQGTGWRAPLYWVKEDGEWQEYTLGGLRPLNPDAPLCHVSYYEADAYARWVGARLPTEQEWEVAAHQSGTDGHFMDAGLFQPDARWNPNGPFFKLFGDVWEWTASAYAAYPGFRPAVGAIGEYNGKFMCNQFVLRGGSCVTPAGHIRATYRNFFPPASRWMFAGVRLARDN